MLFITQIFQTAVKSHPLMDAMECHEALLSIANETDNARFFCMKITAGVGVNVTFACTTGQSNNCRGNDRSFGPHQTYVNMWRSFMHKLSRSGMLKRSGSIIMRAEDFATLPRHIEQRLYRERLPLASHSHLSCVDDPGTIISIPDPHYIGSGGFTGLIKTTSTHSRFISREPKIFWRGVTTGLVAYCSLLPRVQLSIIAKSLPWADIKVASPLVQYCSDKDFNFLIETGALGERKAEVFWAQHRGILDIDGNSNAWGLFWRLGSGSAVFRVESSYCSMYSAGLIPWKHYLPLKSDFSDFQTVTKMVAENSSVELLEKIARNSAAYIRKFTMDKVMKTVAEQLNRAWS